MEDKSYTLGPSFLCPFGWPAQPIYPIDLDHSDLVEGLRSRKDQSDSHRAGLSNQPSNRLPANLLDRGSESQFQFNQLWVQIFNHQDYYNNPIVGGSDEVNDRMVTLDFELNRLYLESLYLNGLRKELSRRLRCYSEEFKGAEEGLIELYESFIIPEDYLAQKWTEEVKRFIQDPNLREDDLRDLMKGEDDGENDEDEDQVFHRNEKQVIKLLIDHSKLFQDVSRASGVTESPSFDSQDQDLTKNRFSKGRTLKEWLEIWSVRETELQIVLLLEIIILTNSSLAHGSQLFHRRQLSSPRKGNNSIDLGSKEGKKKSDLSDQPNVSAVVDDLEMLLEGLVDRLAMWQVIAGFENEFSNLLSDRKAQTNGDSQDTQEDLENLDETQRFWTDVVEEHYASQLPLLNPSFRPKLFPTSIYDPSSSSLLPSQFDSKAQSKSNYPASSVHRTPNLKRLERIALKEASLNQSKNNLLSPTMMKLKGIKDRKPITKRSSISESSLKFQRTSSSSSNSRSLFNRREVNMSKVPSLTKLPIQKVRSSSSGSNLIGRGVWGQANNRMPGELQLLNKRKQNSPRS
ncbi:hypothetical protein BY996DRAFT_4592458 [Phakopsora pachyrhizi]|nr:hypothetical protein BY996DRAFT_4592458 [Phakopsora pachyrhizi]